MSQYVFLDLPVDDGAQLRTALERLGLRFEVAGEAGLTLDGSLECAGEPVEIRVAPGARDTVEDWGFSFHDGRYRLVCADADRPRLEAGVLPDLLAEVARLRLEAAGHRAKIRIDADGTRRVVVDLALDPGGGDDP